MKFTLFELSECCCRSGTLRIGWCDTSAQGDFSRLRCSWTSSYGWVLFQFVLTVSHGHVFAEMYISSASPPRGFSSDDRAPRKSLRWPWLSSERCWECSSLHRCNGHAQTEYGCKRSSLPYSFWSYSEPLQSTTTSSWLHWQGFTSTVVWSAWTNAS